jgi:hypothetical protein
MTHLTDEQYENLLQGQPLDTDHMNHCEVCQSRFKEKQALKSRLNSAFSGVTPSKALVEKIRGQMALTAPAMASHEGPRVLKLSHHRKLWAATLSTVAAILILIPLLKVALVPTPVYADLVDIHQHNLSEGQGYMAQTDPNVLAAHFREQLGFNPRLPELGHGLALRGCCIKHFQGNIVGSYVMDTPQGVISIVVVKDEPAALGMTISSQVGNQTYYQSQFALCDMVAIRIEDHTYCAIGQVSSAYLQTLLEKLLPYTL